MISTTSSASCQRPRRLDYRRPSSAKTPSRAERKKTRRQGFERSHNGKLDVEKLQKVISDKKTGKIPFL